MSERTYTTVLQVSVGGAVLPDPLALRLVEGWVDASLNVPSAFQLTFSDKDGTLTGQFPQLTIGAPVVLLPFADGRAGPPMLTGEVTALEMDADPATGRHLVVRGYDPAHRLLRNRPVVGYAQMTASDIVRRVAARCRVPLGRVDATTTVYELATQPGTTDWDFLSGLAAENDVRLACNGEGRLEFTALPRAAGAPSETTEAAQSPFVLDFGSNTLHSRVALTAADQVDRVSVRGWDMLTRRTLVAPAPARTNTGITADLTPGRVTPLFGPAEATATSAPYTTMAQVTQAARALAEDITGSFAELEVAVTGNPELKPGTPVSVNGAGAPFEGKYTATGVRHVFASGQPFTTWLTVSGRQFRSLYGLASGGAPGGAASAPPMPGVALGVVTNTKDPLKLGRVRLRFPWLSDTYESDWCRVAQVGGVRGGGLTLPEVDDEVLCAFDRGSLAHPYVLAGLYNGIDRPPKEPQGRPAVDPTSGRVNWRSMTARSGHTVELIESGGPAGGGGGILLRTGQGRLRIEMDETSTTLTIDSDDTVTINGMRGVRVESAGDLTLRAGRSLNLEAVGQVGVKAGGSVQVDAAASVSLKAIANASVTAASVTLTGPAVLRNGIPF
ncbi:VgrG-related protein [Streptomyces yaizuensis]|uniref:VgrG-related protein n=1 Tax=Streptomyces yaizuensis TaxID=2989713 RepID=A0ABQ5P2V4_9ACTN|nr:VgrG-related protein [Streptomyces sp. YSPA8]GLF96832.1 VgrG-related protein [Streptomyces sp. YSPA8]